MYERKDNNAKYQIIKAGKFSKRHTDIVIVLIHIDAAYRQLQASLTTLAHNTRSQEHKANIGVAQQDLVYWRVAHWNNINAAPPKKRRM
jgi:hypothetical protein